MLLLGIGLFYLYESRKSLLVFKKLQRTVSKRKICLSLKLFSKEGEQREIGEKAALASVGNQHISIIHWRVINLETTSTPSYWIQTSFIRSLVSEVSKEFSTVW